MTTTTNIFLAGATGAVGRALIPRLLERGHSVTGTTRSPEKADALRALGVTPVVVDGLDRDAVIAAVAAARPDAIVHEMTALGRAGRPPSHRAASSRRPTACARRAPTTCSPPRRRPAWSASSRRATPGGPTRARRAGQDRGRPARPAPPAQMRTTLDAIRHVESRRSPPSAASCCATAASTARGPGSRRAASSGTRSCARKFPVVGDGGGVWSFVHIDDAAGATVSALERWTPGEIYNVVDDEPAPVREWLPALASTIGARPPRHVPRFVGRLMGEHIVVDDVRDPRRVEREGARRPRLEPGLADLARGLRRDCPDPDRTHPYYPPGLSCASSSATTPIRSVPWSASGSRRPMTSTWSASRTIVPRRCPPCATRGRTSSCSTRWPRATTSSRSITCGTSRRARRSSCTAVTSRTPPRQFVRGEPDLYLRKGDEPEHLIDALRELGD